jgi:hypothetical protein
MIEFLIGGPMLPAFLVASLVLAASASAFSLPRLVRGARGEEPRIAMVINTRQ